VLPYRWPISRQVHLRPIQWFGRGGPKAEILRVALGRLVEWS
jgi:hypothetical protein